MSSRRGRIYVFVFPCDEYIILYTYYILYYVLARLKYIYIYYMCVYTETKNWAHNYCTIYIYALRRVLYRLLENDHRVQNNDCPSLRSPPPMSLVVFSGSLPSSTPPPPQLQPSITAAASHHPRTLRNNYFIHHPSHTT